MLVPVVAATTTAVCGVAEEVNWSTPVPGTELGRPCCCWAVVVLEVSDNDDNGKDLLFLV